MEQLLLLRSSVVSRDRNCNILSPGPLTLFPICPFINSLFLSFSPTPFQNQLCLFLLRRFKFENQSISTHRRINIQTRRPTLFVTTSRRLRAMRAENLYRAIHLPNVDALPPRFPQIVHVSAYIIPLPSNGNLVSFPRNSSIRSDFQWIGHLARSIEIQKSNTIFKKR